MLNANNGVNSLPEPQTSQFDQVEPSVAVASPIVSVTVNTIRENIVGEGQDPFTHQEAIGVSTNEVEMVEEISLTEN